MNSPIKRILDSVWAIFTSGGKSSITPLKYLSRGWRTVLRIGGALYQIGRTGALSGQNLDRAEAYYKLYLQNERGSNNPSLASTHWRLGMVYEHKGEKELAREEYLSALKFDPELEQAKKALKKLK